MLPDWKHQILPSGDSDDLLYRTDAFELTISSSELTLHAIKRSTQWKNCCKKEHVLTLNRRRIYSCNKVKGQNVQLCKKIMTINSRKYCSKRPNCHRPVDLSLQKKKSNRKKTNFQIGSVESEKSYSNWLL